jgi:hypothetical protein
MRRHSMQTGPILRLAFLLAVSACPGSALSAQAADEEISLATLAAPVAMRDGATIIDLRPDGTTSVLRPGTNGLICWNNKGRPGAMGAVDVQCTVEENRGRLEQNHAFESAGGTVGEVQARFRQAEADGSRVLPVFGSIFYRHYLPMGEEAAGEYRTHTTVAVPYATEQSLGFPTARGSGMLWLMEAGTSSAHLMVSGM